MWDGREADVAAGTGRSVAPTFQGERLPGGVAVHGDDLFGALSRTGRQDGHQPDHADTHDGDCLAWTGHGGAPPGGQHVGGGQQARHPLAVRVAETGDEFLDLTSRRFFVDGELFAGMCAVVIRADTCRVPHDRALQDLVGKMSTRGHTFSSWPSKD